MMHRDLLPEVLLRAQIAQRHDEGCNLRDLPARVEAAISAGTIGGQEEAFWLEVRLRSYRPLRQGAKTHPTWKQSGQCIPMAHADSYCRFAVAVIFKAVGFRM
jgi:hypothetical protein